MAYFTVAELRTRFPEINSVDYPDPQVEAVQATAEEAFEDACGVPFEPRERTETLSGNAGTLLALRGPLVAAVSAVTVDGATVDVSGVSVMATGDLLYRVGRWTRGTQNVVVTYSYGHPAPPLRVKQAVMLLTRVWLVEGPISARATQLPTETGGVINLATPGMLGATFGIPEVDATVERYRWVTYVA